MKNKRPATPEEVELLNLYYSELKEVINEYNLLDFDYSFEYENEYGIEGFRLHFSNGQYSDGLYLHVTIDGLNPEDEGDIDFGINNFGNSYTFVHPQDDNEVDFTKEQRIFCYRRYCGMLKNYLEGKSYLP